MSDHSHLPQVPIDYSRLADLYDGLVDFDRDIAFFIAEARSAGGPVLELMCGTGRVSLPLIEAGIDLTCVDLSAEMLAVLRAKLAGRGLGARIVHGDVRSLFSGQDAHGRGASAKRAIARPGRRGEGSPRNTGAGAFKPGGFPLAILPFNSFSELLTDEDRMAALSSVRAALVEGGRFICTLHNPAVRLAGLDGTTRLLKRFPHPSGSGQVEFRLRASLDPVTRIATGEEILEHYDEGGRRASSRVIEIRFSLPERAQFEALAVSAGFSVGSFYGDYDRSEYRADESPFMIWILGR